MCAVYNTKTQNLSIAIHTMLNQLKEKQRKQIKKKNIFFNHRPQYIMFMKTRSSWPHLVKKTKFFPLQVKSFQIIATYQKFGEGVPSTTSPPPPPSLYHGGGMNLLVRPTVKRNSLVFKLGKCRWISLKFNPWESHPSLNWERKKLSLCVYFHLAPNNVE